MKSNRNSLFGWKNALYLFLVIVGVLIISAIIEYYMMQSQHKYLTNDECFVDIDASDMQHVKVTSNCSIKPHVISPNGKKLIS